MSIELSELELKERLGEVAMEGEALEDCVENKIDLTVDTVIYHGWEYARLEEKGHVSWFYEGDTHDHEMEVMNSKLLDALDAFYEEQIKKDSEKKGEEDGKTQ